MNLFSWIWRSKGNREALQSQNMASYYGQEGEDAVLAAFLNSQGSACGFFVDVGAYHPTRFSNTWKYYQAGWRGVNIDSTPGSMKAFNEMRPEDVNLEIAVSANGETRKLYCYNEPALNGIDNDRAEELKDTHFRLVNILDVPTLKLAAILGDNDRFFRHPSFLTIDVEGHEIDVLKSNDWQRWYFDFVLVEQRLEDLTKIGNTEVFTFLTALNYQAVACTGRTVLYRSTDFAG